MGMKVLVLSPSIIKEKGGVQRYTITLVRALKELIGEKNLHLLTIQEKKHKNHRGGYEITRKLRIFEKVRFVYNVLRNVIFWRPELIICAHIGLAPIGQLLHIFIKSPYWIVVYGIEVWGKLSFLKQIALSRAERIIAISNFTQNRLIYHKIPFERTVVLPCALNNNFIEDSGFERMDGERQKIILTVGRIDSSWNYKGHRVVIQALPEVLRKVPELVYIIVGEGDDRTYLEKLAEKVGVKKNVIFTGSVSEQELFAFYKACDIFVMPAKTELNDHAPKGEGFGIVFLEAMAFGKPVIGPDYGAPREFIQNKKHGFLVNPDNSEEVANAIVTLLTQPEMAKKMGEAGRKWVMKEFSYERFRERLAEMLY